MNQSQRKSKQIRILILLIVGVIFLVGCKPEKSNCSESYKNGYTAGKEAGYKQGHDVGYKKGYPDGYNAGYEVGYGNGYNAGRNAN